MLSNMSRHEPNNMYKMSKDLWQMEKALTPLLCTLLVSSQRERKRKTSRTLLKSRLMSSGRVIQSLVSKPLEPNTANFVQRKDMKFSNSLETIQGWPSTSAMRSMGPAATNHDSTGLTSHRTPTPALMSPWRMKGSPDLALQHQWAPTLPIQLAPLVTKGRARSSIQLKLTRALRRTRWWTDY